MTKLIALQLSADSIKTTLHAFPREIPHTLHHNYPIPTQDDCSLHQQEQLQSNQSQHTQVKLVSNNAKSNLPSVNAGIGYQMLSKDSSTLNIPEQSLPHGSTMLSHQQILHTHPPSSQQLPTSKIASQATSHQHQASVPGAPSTKHGSSPPQQQRQHHSSRPPPAHPFHQNPPLTTSYESARAHLSTVIRGNVVGSSLNNMSAVSQSSINLDALGSIYDDTIGSLNNTVCL